MAKNSVKKIIKIEPVSTAPVNRQAGLCLLPGQHRNREAEEFL